MLTVYVVHTHTTCTNEQSGNTHISCFLHSNYRTYRTEFAFLAFDLYLLFNPPQKKANSVSSRSGETRVHHNPTRQKLKTHSLFHEYLSKNVNRWFVLPVRRLEGGGHEVTAGVEWRVMLSWMTDWLTDCKLHTLYHERPAAHTPLPL